MPDCRLYCLDREGHISEAEWIEAHDDADAVTKARQLKRQMLKCEVWQQDRLVAVLDAGDLAD